MTKVQTPEGEELQRQLQALSDEAFFKLILHETRVRLRAKEIKNVNVIQEIINELSQAGL
jgi:hypothetical protein